VVGRVKNTDVPLLGRRPICVLLLLGLLCSTLTSARTEKVQDAATASRIAAFGRLYGYVRFFHPSDAAASADWTRIAVEGSRRVRLAANPSSLERTLHEIFSPFVVDMELYEGGLPKDRSNDESTGGNQYTHWQYSTIAFDRANPLQRRVVSGVSAGPRAALFESGVKSNEKLTVAIGEELWLRMPLSLPVDSELRTQEPSNRFRPKEGSDDSTYSLNDPDVRIAGVLIAWNVLQHFFPYWKEVDTDWPSLLPHYIEEALIAESAESYYQVVSELVATTRDGHGYVFGRPETFGGLPILVEHIEENLVVTASTEESPIQKGDVIVSINGVEGRQLLKERFRTVSGSDQLREFRALNQYGDGRLNDKVNWLVVREGREQEISFQLGKDPRGYFWNMLSAYSHPSLFEPEPGIFYINLQGCAKADFIRRLPEISSAQAVIFDWRRIGPYAPEDDQIDVISDVLPHLTTEELPAPPIYLSSIAFPDGRHLQGRPVQWTIPPKDPLIKGKAVFITVPGVVSYGETCTALIQHHRLGALVGDTTAGCNGGASFIPLPGGLRVMWTQMRVTKHGGARLYLDGYQPDHRVSLSIAAVLRGEDQYLKKAIEVARPAVSFSE
jgi:hypothetical protein